MGQVIYFIATFAQPTTATLLLLLLLLLRLLAETRGEVNKVGGGNKGWGRGGGGWALRQGRQG